MSKRSTEAPTHIVQSMQLQVYKIENLQNIIKDSQVNQIPNISIDKKKYSKNFFNRNSKKSLKPVVQPVLDEKLKTDLQPTGD